MPGFIIDGEEHIPHGMTVVNYLDDPRLKLKLGEDMFYRGHGNIRVIGAHTTACFKNKLLPGIGPDRNVDLKVARIWRADGRKAGAHLTIDFDGSIGCHADLLKMRTLHGIYNTYSVGIEIAKRWTPKGGIYLYQLEVFVKLCDYLCRFFGIQRACVHPSMLNKQISGRSAKSMMGVVGHMHRTRHKPNDPGREPFEMLVEAGFLPFTYASTPSRGEILPDDRVHWRVVQKDLNTRFDADLDIDGYPYSETHDALMAAGYPDGLWHDGPIGEAPVGATP